MSSYLLFQKFCVSSIYGEVLLALYQGFVLHREETSGVTLLELGFTPGLWLNERSSMHVLKFDPLPEPSAP